MWARWWRPAYGWCGPLQAHRRDGGPGPRTGVVARAEAGPLSRVLINLLLQRAGDGRAEYVKVLARLEERRGPGCRWTRGRGLRPVMPRLFEPFFTTKGRQEYGAWGSRCRCGWCR